MADTYNMSDYLENAIFDHIFRTATFSKPTTLYVALCSGVPISSNTGANIPELANAGAYARATIGAPANTLFGAQPADNYGGNNAVITFTAASANWAQVSGCAIVDSATYGAGNVLLWGALTTPKNVGTGDTFSFPVSGIQIRFD